MSSYSAVSCRAVTTIAQTASQARAIVSVVRRFDTAAAVRAAISASGVPVHQAGAHSSTAAAPASISSGARAVTIAPSGGVEQVRRADSVSGVLHVASGDLWRVNEKSDRYQSAL
ncbi:hypothetical protein [Streptomyces sp. NPDC051684]|uniref:hypothetical protein n=1 Tax=Streptomyces sp. NPDC051684 TaxID=3365670 RepID=UPI00378B99B2